MYNKDYKIVFVDIDWTILDHEIHDWDYYTIDVLKNLQKEGIFIYLNTARPYDSIVHTGLFDIFTPDGIVCTNGGVIFVGEELFFENVIPEDIVRQIEKVANKHHLVLELATSKDRYFTAIPNTYVYNYFTIYQEVKPDVKKYHNKDVSAILLFAPEKYDEVLRKEFPSCMNLLRFDTHGVDVTYIQNIKGDGVKRVLDHLNIDKSQAIGVGDSFGDISMFEEVGLSIAMGNGTVEAREKANITCDPISGHGLGIILEKLFKKSK